MPQNAAEPKVCENREKARNHSNRQNPKIQQNREEKRTNLNSR